MKARFMYKMTRVELTQRMPEIAPIRMDRKDIYGIFARQDDDFFACIDFIYELVNAFPLPDVDCNEVLEEDPA